MSKVARLSSKGHKMDKMLPNKLLQAKILMNTFHGAKTEFRGVRKKLLRAVERLTAP